MAEQPDLGVTWEQQIRPWITSASLQKTPSVVVRYFPGGESREELFALYQGAQGEFTIAFAKTREINAQSFSNTFIHELQQTPPSIPIDLKTININTRQALSLISDTNLFLTQRPKSWELLAQMAHGGSIFILSKDSSYLYQGPIDPRGGSTISRIIERLTKIRSLLAKSQSQQVFEFPAVKQLTQWRFCRALIQGDERLSIYLLSIGADPNKDPRFPETPIEHAIRGGFKSLLNTLLKLGADPTAKTSEGATPLELASEANNHWAIPIIQASIQSNK